MSDQWVDLLKFTAGLLVGPLGVALGWLLGERSRARQAQREGAEARRGAVVERVMNLLALARVMSTEAHSLGHGYWLQAGGRPIDRGQKRGVIDAFNDARGKYELELLKIQALGPTWLVDPAVEVENSGREAASILIALEGGAKGQPLQDIQEVITRQKNQIEAMVILARTRFDDDH